MKLLIKIKFKDKYTGAKYEEGDIVDFKEERAKELLADERNLVAKVEDAAPESEEVQEEKPESTRPKKKKK